MTALYYLHHVPESQRVRLALAYKNIAVDAKVPTFDDDAVFFALGRARQVPLLQLDDGTVLTDSLTILARMDALFPAGPPLCDAIDAAAWDALCRWRAHADPLLQRLYAAAAPAYRGVGDDAAALTAYRAATQARLGVTLEQLANDRYAAFAQLDALTRFKELARTLAARRFYTGAPSIADMLLAADLFPLQVLDGVSLPVDLLYYIARVEACCHATLGAGLLAA